MTQHQPEGARDAEQRLALWVIHNPDAAAARIEELTKALETIAGSTTDKLQALQAKAALENIGPSVSLEGRGGAT